MVTSRGIPVAPPRCGFAFHPFDRHTAPAVLRAWSPLEYGCHTRDMSELFHERLVKMLGVGPARPLRIAPDPWSGAEFLRPYREEDPRRVAPGLRRAAEDLARRFEDLSQAGWDHPDPAADPRLSVEFFTSHFLHDVGHDLHEVSRLRGPEAAG
ncbi:hypothetical protein [Streptomyces sp. NPDC090994]|uniref:hypothetical protein n=1 Tax=Streptomyces sp. NPDC090994 TaxID=3365969 RepID=UPI0038007A2F